uniref:Uncharacterized protein n=1 Tax=Desulfacinum infernum TaxID=35837 RepID=A0A831ZZ66_9BACT
MTWHEAARQALDVFFAHPVSLILSVLAVSTLVSIHLIRKRLRRHWTMLLEEASEEPFCFLEESSLSDKDRAAVSYLQELRRKVWSTPDREMTLSFDAFLARAQDIVRTVASIYYPDKEEPEYQASLENLLALSRRTASRLETIVRRGPFRLLSSRPIGHYRTLYRTYRRVNESALVQSLRRYPFLYRAARLFWSVKNWNNPLYWVGKELSRESLQWLVRWFSIALINQVGKEAMRLYGTRTFADDEERDLVLVCVKLYALCASQEPSRREESFRAWVSFVCDIPLLDDAVKIRLLRQTLGAALDGEAVSAPFRTRRGDGWYRKGLARLGLSRP